MPSAYFISCFFTMVNGKCVHQPIDQDAFCLLYFLFFSQWSMERVSENPSHQSMFMQFNLKLPELLFCACMLWNGDIKHPTNTLSQKMKNNWTCWWCPASPRCSRRRQCSWSALCAPPAPAHCSQSKENIMINYHLIFFKKKTKY